MAINPALMALVKGAKNKYSRGGQSIKLKEGSTTLRLVGAPGAKFWAENGVHWIKTEKGGKPVAVCGCEDEVHQKPCPICTAIDKASKTASDDETLAIIKEWKVKKNVLVNALIRSGTDASETPQVVELTAKAFSAMTNNIEIYANDPGGEIDILDFKTGIDFVVTRSGKGFDTDYVVTIAPRSKPVPDGTVERLVDLDAYIEKEFFRGDDRKALTAIANMTGVSVGSAALTAPAPRAGLLTGPSAAVDDAVIEESVVEELEAAPATAPDNADAELAAAEAELEAATKAAADKVAKLKAAAIVKATAAAAKPATTPAPSAAPAKAAAEDKSDVEAMLAELDGITA